MKHATQLCQEDKLYNPNTSDFWDKKIHDLGEEILKSPIYKNKNDLIVKSIKKASGNIMNVGFGYGYIEKLILQNNIKLKLFGIDISKYAVDNVNKLYKGTFKVASINKIPFKNDLFDIVLALDVLEHLPEKNILIALKEIYRITRKGGKFIVTLPVNESNEDKLNNGHLRDYTFDLIKKELEKSGFFVVNSKFLYAFKSYYYFKSLINRIFHIKKPNLIIVFAIKK